MRLRITKHRGQRDRGAAAVIVGASLVAVLGATALAVDLGNHRSTNARTTTAADSAALAASVELNDGATDAAACAVAAGQVVANEAGATMQSCSIGTASNGQDIVTVEVQEDVDYVFAQVLGLGSGTVTSTTSARHSTDRVGGARPFGLCIEALGSRLAGWDPLGTASIGPVTVPYGKSGQPAACNGGSPVPGNWGSLDLDGGSNSTADQVEWIENGYNDGSLAPGQWISGDTGALGGSVSAALDTLVNSDETFAVPMFGSICCGSGSNVEFGVVGFVTAQLTGYDVDGPEDSRSLSFVFHPGQWPGVQCCDIGGASLQVLASGICATDEDTGAC